VGRATAKAASLPPHRALSRRPFPRRRHAPWPLDDTREPTASGAISTKPTPNMAIGGDHELGRRRRRWSKGRVAFPIELKEHAEKQIVRLFVD